MRPSDSFSFMAQLARDWINGDRLEEIARLLDLVRHEPGQRGVKFTWRTTPQMRRTAGD